VESNTHQENLSHLNDLFAVAQANGALGEFERSFLQQVAKALQIDANWLPIIEKGEQPIAFTPPRHEHNIIPQFHRILLLLFSSEHLPLFEAQMLCKRLALRMGLNLLAVDELLEMLNQQPDDVTQPDKIAAVFKKYYN